MSIPHAMCLKLVGVFFFLLPVLICRNVEAELQKADGYRGIWYSNQPTKDEYRYKYSGGMATYCMKHIPMAVYAPTVHKTFFVYGGTDETGKTLLEMVSYYDHATGKIPRPTILMDKHTDDAHDNPVISLDDEGHLWIFVSSHGTARPSYILRSQEPYSIDKFETVLETNFSYPQPWHIAGKGFLFLHTRYAKGRGLYYSTSADGRTWTDPVSLSHIGEGHYQISWPCGDKVGTAFDYHPKGKGLNYRTNLYYLETPDIGKTWLSASGQRIETPLAEVHNPALVHNYEAEGLLVYVKDLNFDKENYPAVLYVTSKGWQPGPQNGPHTWRVAHWTAGAWSLSDVTVSDNNYDSGSLYIGDDGVWQILGPTDAGREAFNPGGEIVLWTSKDNAKSWVRTRSVTRHSLHHNSHVRRPLNAHPNFWAFWADGDTRQHSESRLFFCDKTGKQVRMMPLHMQKDFQKPKK